MSTCLNENKNVPSQNTQKYDTLRLSTKQRKEAIKELFPESLRLLRRKQSSFGESEDGCVIVEFNLEVRKEMRQKTQSP